MVFHGHLELQGQLEKQELAGNTGNPNKIGIWSSKKKGGHGYFFKVLRSEY